MNVKTLFPTLVASISLLLPLTSSAGGFQWEWKPKYTGEIHTGYKTTTSAKGIKMYTGMVELGTLQGVSLNQYLDLSVGVDAFMLTHYYKGNGMRFGGYAYFDMRPGYPVNNDFKVFLDLGLGGFFNIHSEPEYGRIGDGFFCQFGPGIRYKKLNLSMGLQSFGTADGSVGFFSKIGIYF